MNVSQTYIKVSFDLVEIIQLFKFVFSWFTTHAIQPLLAEKILS